MADNQRSTGRFDMRWAVYALAVAVVLLDQWSKDLVVEHLASPAHPMVLVGDGEVTAAQLLAGRGLVGEPLELLLSRRVVWLYQPAKGLNAAMKLDDPAVPRQLVMTSGCGFPLPRRLRVLAGVGGGDLGALVESECRIERSELPRLFAESTWRAVRPLQSLDDIPTAEQRLVVLERNIELVPSFMKLVYAENPGAAWGFLRDASPVFRHIFFSLVSLFAVIGMVWAIWTGWMGSALGTWALGAVLGGAIGNVIDRSLYQVVVDFILNYVGEYRWPVYNVADIAITVGVSLIVLELLLYGARKKDSEAGLTETDAKG